jgi:hypothetical protein
MSIKQPSRSAVASAAHTEWSNLTSAVLVSAILVPLIGFLLLVRTEFLLPSISAIALASAAIIALAAWCMSSDRNSARISLWDVSGAYAFIGFAAAMLSEPQDVLEFLSVPPEIHEPAR